MSVVELGSDADLHEITVEADNWMSALRTGRKTLGEDGAVPPGSSCAVAPDGKVTILDPIERRRFVLQVDTSASFRPAAVSAGPRVPSDPTPKSVPPPAAKAAAPVSPPATPPATPPAAIPPATPPAASANPSPKPGAPKKKRKAARTMAYIPETSLPKAPPDKPKKRSPSKTMAYLPPSAEVVRKSSPPPAKSGDDGSEAASASPPPTPASSPAAPTPPSSPVADASPPSPVAAEASGSEATASTKSNVVPEPAPKTPSKAPEPSVIVAPEPEPSVIVAPEPEPSVIVAPEPEPSIVVSPEASQPAATGPGSGVSHAMEPLGAHDGDFGAHGPTRTAWKVLQRRDQEPSDASPLTYRERSYAVPSQTSSDVAEAIARERSASLMELLAHVPRGRFINIAVFDHEWTDRPLRPPLATLALKDWQGDAVVERPLDAQRQSAAPQARTRSTTNDHDRRLATAFEACQDLPFLGSPLEGVEFAQRLLADLVPCAAITACLYDIDADVHRVVVATGPGGEARRGAEIPHGAGLSAVAVSSGLAVRAGGDDARIAPEHEGREGLEIASLLCLPSAHNRRHLALLQLLNRKDRPFDQADADLGHYIAQQLGEFLYNKRIAAQR